MKAEDFIDVFMSDDLSPVDACYEIIAEAEAIGAGAKALYRGRWIGAESRDNPDILHRVLLGTPPDWPGIVTVKTRVSA